MRVRLLISVLGLSAVGAAVSAQTELPHWADPDVVSVNQEQGRPWLVPLGPEEEPDRWQMDLSGEWRFLLLDRAADVPSDLEASLARDLAWSTIQVPGSWQSQGVGNLELARSGNQNPLYGSAGAANPAGILLRDFTLAPGWQDRQTLLHVTRARSSITVLVNGVEVGYSENTAAGAEFNLTRNLQSGVNRLVLIVTQWSTSSEHSGVHWTFAGLLDEPLLISLPAVYLRDLSLDARYDPQTGSGTLNLRAWLRSFLPYSSEGYRIEIDLLDSNGRRVGRRFRRGVAVGAAREMTASLRLQLANVRSWSAESPNLYELEIRLVGEDQLVVQRSRDRVGFRLVTFTPTGLLINGRRETLRGVTLDADLPVRVVDSTDIEHHLHLLKNAGINALRLQSPLSQRWYDRIDAFGLYTFHDLRIPPSQGNVARTFERNVSAVELAKNHPSTLAWVWRDTGQPGASNFGAWVEAHDPTRPVLPNKQVRLASTPRAWIFDRQVRNSDALFVLWPFGSLLGNSGGGLGQLWRMVETQERAVGGFLPHWMASATPSGSDAVDRGLVDQNARPLPAYQEIADLYRTFRFTAIDLSTNTFAVTNDTHNTSTSGTEGQWKLRQDGAVVAGGRLPRLGGEPGATTEFRIGGLPDLLSGAQYHLTLELNSAVSDSADQETLARAQFELPTPGEPILNPVADLPPLTVETEGSGSRLVSREVEVAIDGTTGSLSEFSFRGQSMIDGLVRPSLWRKPTMLEQANGLAAIDRRLQSIFDGEPADWVGRRVTAGSHSAVSEYTVADEGLFRMQTTSHGTGAVELALHWFGEPGTPDPPRVGASIPLSPRAVSVEWFGRGPGASYSDRKSSAELGRWETSIPWKNPYVWDQAHGLRSELRWLVVWFSDATGLLIVTPSSASFSTGYQSGTPVLYLDGAHRGVGAERDNAIPSRAARIPPGEHRFTFLLLPIVVGQNPAQLAKNSWPNTEIAAAIHSPSAPPRWRLRHLAVGRPLDITEAETDPPPTQQSKLNDGWNGSIDAFDGTWSPINSFPSEITLDLQTVEPVNRLRLGVLRHESACADVPASVEFSYSLDRRRWIAMEPLVAESNPDSTLSPKRQWLDYDLLGRPIRWVRARLTAPVSVCLRTGEANRVLVDEWVVE